ncbi:Gp37 family protein [Serratia sp. Ag2]|uniref:Gp37 family protein n=1 Tax=Serratia sp. Ag2 TaxID=1532556 RepID=UPI000503B813|nr:Gp37 family protein [Serratia sp. Ag2]KFK91933.1 hypothetical protein JV45_23495 [Serratia sp. Ag2]
MNTSNIIEATVERLRRKLPALHSDFFPENPDTFRLNHSLGALLVSYGSSDYGNQQDIGAVLQPQTVKFTVTVVVRQLNGKGGAVDILDYVRQALGGWTPPNCRRRVWLIHDRFLGQVNGVWQYVLTFATETVFIQDVEPNDLPLLTEVNYEESES